MRKKKRSTWPRPTPMCYRTEEVLTRRGYRLLDKMRHQVAMKAFCEDRDEVYDFAFEHPTATNDDGTATGSVDSSIDEIFTEAELGVSLWHGKS